MNRKVPRDEIESTIGPQLLTQGRFLALLPTGKVALEAPDLIAQGQYLVVGQQLVVAAVATLTIAMIYRLVEWISTFQGNTISGTFVAEEKRCGFRTAEMR